MAVKLQAESTIATAQIVDACMRLKVPYRIAPAGIKAVASVTKMIAGPVLPARHYGSVDIFLEALETNATKDAIFVIGNQNRQDEACIGDLIALEAKHSGIKAMVIWGLHRDTTDLIEIRLPVFSYGAYPSGPARLDEREAEALIDAPFGDFKVTAADTAFADDDGVVFVETTSVPQVLELAQTIRGRERLQAEAATKGTSLRTQFGFQDYLKRREADDAYTFRKHISGLARSIEE